MKHSSLSGLWKLTPFSPFIVVRVHYEKEGTPIKQTTSIQQRKSFPANTNNQVMALAGCSSCAYFDEKHFHYEKVNREKPDTKVNL